MRKNPYTVFQVMSYIKHLLDEDLVLGSVSVIGEVSNYKSYPSGHLYFSLKDENAAIKCVMFRSAACYLNIKLKDGMKAVVRGRVSAYEKSGDCQLYAEYVQEAGVGDLYAAFEQLKQKLMGEGLFDEARKRPIPAFARRVAVVTSAQGAALRDIIQIARRRNPCVGITICDTRVQGDEAPAEIAAAIRRVNAACNADCIIVGRGGGSYEDLQAFNDERVAVAIAESKIPVISAVGHETDFTIADFVADLRAPTPSAAAELAVFDYYAAREYISDNLSRSRLIIQNRLSACRQALSRITSRRILQNPKEFVYTRQMYVNALSDKARNTVTMRLKEARAHLGYLVNAANHLSPYTIVNRGYAVVRDENGTIINNVDDLPGTVNIVMRGGSANASITEVIHAEETNV